MELLKLYSPTAFHTSSTFALLKVKHVGMSAVLFYYFEGSQR